MRRDVIVTRIKLRRDGGQCLLEVKELYKGRPCNKQYWTQLTMKAEYHGRAPDAMAKEYGVDMEALLTPSLPCESVDESELLDMMRTIANDPPAATSTDQDEEFHSPDRIPSSPESESA